MATMAIRDPRIAAGFGQLADAMFPSPVRAAQVQVLASQRDMNLARAGVYDAQSSQVWNDVDGARLMQSTLTSPDYDPSRPHDRARLMGAAALRADGLRYAPQFAAQATGVLRPDTPNLSTILAAGGQDYRATPQGLADVIAGNANVARINTDGRVLAAEAGANARIEAAQAAADARVAAAQETAAGRGAGRGQNTRYVSPADAAKMQEAVRARLLDMSRDTTRDRNLADTQLDVENTYVQALTAQAIQRFQEHGNPAVALDETFRELPANIENTSGWFRSGARIRPRPGQPAGAPAAPATPPAPATTPTRPAQTATVGEGTIIRNRATGEVRVMRNGQWVVEQ